MYVNIVNAFFFIQLRTRSISYMFILDSVSDPIEKKCRLRTFKKKRSGSGHCKKYFVFSAYTSYFIVSWIRLFLHQIFTRTAKKVWLQNSG